MNKVLITKMTVNWQISQSLRNSSLIYALHAISSAGSGLSCVQNKTGSCGPEASYISRYEINGMKKLFGLADPRELKHIENIFIFNVSAPTCLGDEGMTFLKVCNKFSRHNLFYTPASYEKV